MTFLIHAGCGGSMSAATYGIDYCWGGTRLKQQAYRLFGAGDGRAAFFWTTGQTDSVIDIGTFTNGIAAPKFTNKTSAGTNGAQSGMVDTDFPIFPARRRVSDLRRGQSARRPAARRRRR